MAENDLNNDPNVSNFLSSLNAVFSALRGTFAPRNNAGNVGDGAADIGSSTNNWDRIYAKQLIVGGNAIDLAAIAASATIYVFDATDASFSWPLSKTKCLAFAFSGVAGGEGTTGTGADGGATTVTRGSATLTSRAQPASAGPGGIAPTESRYFGWGNTAAGFGANDDIGTQRARTRIFTGLSQGDSFNIQLGAGGAGGSGGGAAGDDGFALLFAF